MPRKRTPKVRICEWCGNIIGAERGPASKTCSPECQRDRNNAKEKARYERIKDTPEWKETRADYLERVKQKVETDPEYAERWRTPRRAAVARHRDRQNADPVLREQILLRKRERMRVLAARINADPVARAAKLKKQRDWYRSLSKEEIERYFYEPKRRRDYERNILSRLEIAAARADESTKINHIRRGQRFSYWTAEQTQYLREHYASTQAADIAAHIGRTVQAVSTKAFDLGLAAEQGRETGGDGGGQRQKLRWTAREDAALRKWYGRYTAHELAFALSRTVDAVKARIKVLRLFNSQRTRIFIKHGGV